MQQALCGCAILIGTLVLSVPLAVVAGVLLTVVLTEVIGELKSSVAEVIELAEAATYGGFNID